MLLAERIQSKVSIVKIEIMTPEQLINEFNAGHGNLGLALFHLIHFLRNRPELLELNTWAEKERNGYSEGDVIPTYRVLPVQWISGYNDFEQGYRIGEHCHLPEGFETPAECNEYLEQIFDPWPVRVGARDIPFATPWEFRLPPPKRMDGQITHGTTRESYKIAKGIIDKATTELKKLLPHKQPLAELPESNRDTLSRLLDYLQYFHCGADLLKDRKKKGNEKDVRSYPITNEYAIQDLMLSALLPWIWDLKPEFWGETNGEHTPRYDLYSPRLNLIIELKYCTKENRDKILESCREKMPTYVRDRNVEILIYYIWNTIVGTERAIEDYYSVQNAFNNDLVVNQKPCKTIMVISHQSYPMAKRP